MVSRENVVKSLSEEDRRWIARCQMIAVFLFLALVAGLVLWPVLPSATPANRAQRVRPRAAEIPTGLRCVASWAMNDIGR